MATMLEAWQFRQLRCSSSLSLAVWLFALVDDEMLVGLACLIPIIMEFLWRISSCPRKNGTGSETSGNKEAAHENGLRERALRHGPMAMCDCISARQRATWRLCARQGNTRLLPCTAACPFPGESHVEEQLPEPG